MAGRRADPARAPDAAARGVLARARSLLATVQAALADGDERLARATAGELARATARYDSPLLRAWSCHAQGLLAVADGRWGDAVADLESALAGYRSQGQRYAMAQVHESLAVARLGLGQDAAAEAAEATAVATYRDLGADPDVARLTPTRHVGHLTVREVEVLACVEAGSTNRQVASQLLISEKTVSRHLSNIFTKLGVGSRTAASAWAREQGIRPTPPGTSPAPRRRRRPRHAAT